MEHIEEGLLGGKKCRWSLLACTILILVLSWHASPSLAKLDFGPLGPYNLSFDLNTSGEYEIKAEKPYTAKTPDGIGFTQYNLSVHQGGQFMYIFLIEYHNLTRADYYINRRVVNDLLVRLKTSDIQIFYEIIDGHDGAFGAGQEDSGRVIFLASYYPDSMEVGEDIIGRLNLRMLSTFSYETTVSFLNSVQVQISSTD